VAASLSKFAIFGACVGTPRALSEDLEGSRGGCRFLFN
jgi:hypothetical protein